MKYYSELTKIMYDTEEACVAAENAHKKAEEDKKTSYQNAIAELDTLSEHFKQCQKEQDATYKKMVEASNRLNKKYADFQKTFGRLPEKYYTDFILTRLL